MDIILYSSLYLNLSFCCRKEVQIFYSPSNFHLFVLVIKKCYKNSQPICILIPMFILYMIYSRRNPVIYQRCLNRLWSIFVNMFYNVNYVMLKDISVEYVMMKKILSFHLNWLRRVFVKVCFFDQMKQKNTDERSASRLSIMLSYSMSWK